MMNTPYPQAIWRIAMCLLFAGQGVLQAAEVPVTHHLQAVEVTALPGGRLDIQLQMDQGLTSAPASFTLSNPPRIVFDLPDTANAMGKNVVAVNQGALKSVQVAQANDRSRVVLNLAKPVPHEVVLRDQQLVVALAREAAEPQADAAAGKRFTEPVAAASAAHRIQQIDFVRGRNGEGRIIIGLSDNNVAVNVKNAGKTVVVDFANAELPEHLQRRLNVLNFNTPVMYIDAMRQRQQTAQIVIEPTGDWEQSAYQTDRKLVVDIRPVVKDPNKLIQGSRSGYVGEKLSLNFQRVDVRDVLKVIADFTGKNIVVSDAVSGSVTLGLKDVPWDQALDVVMKSKGLDMRVNGSVITVAPAEEFAAKEKAQMTAEMERETLEILRTEVFSLKYQKAADFRNMLLGGGPGMTGASSSMSSGAGGARLNRILSARGSVTYDARTNTIFVQDTPKKLEEIQAIINKVDIAVKQVMIESRMVIASNTFSKSLGARFGISQTGTPGSNTAVSIGGSLGNKATSYTPPTTAGTNGTYTLGNQGGTIQSATLGNYTVSSNGQPDLMSNLPVTNAYGSIALSLLKLSANLLLNLELSALEADARGKVISSPRVTTANQQKARIAQGVEIPYQTATSSGATAVSFKKAELSLEVTPQITPDQKIIMDLDVRKDSKGEETSGGVAINTQNVQTQVLVGNGETVVLGGIYEQVSRKSTDKVPFFGDLPVVGFAFKRNTKQEDKTELLIFITPKVMDDSLNLN